MKNLLKEKLGYTGIIVTDALDMQGVLQDPKVNVDLECLLLSEVGIYEKVIKELIYDIHQELSAEWDDIWSFDDVTERFDKGEMLWLVLKDNKPISCSWISLRTRYNLFIYNTWLNPKFRGTDLFEKISIFHIFGDSVTPIILLTSFLTSNLSVQFPWLNLNSFSFFKAVK